ncbi:SWI/SNF complex subunit SWI3A isoform X2 [Argentina anserina]|uniref:SWI/SNF complex subunit SWI3A isoform X2 n=1 Tax=Argentina anserina TaxID=57926 RepID=UPI002176715A|nr:SWI/SNF complex subunit SWI3A isoform X2 [Potentilla anserina]
MEIAPHDPGSKQLRPDEPELDLYTIPSHSSWFLWDEIHETERIALKEFFDGRSISRTPKVYKEYRDFIINKYREDPARKLTFTEIRKSLVGDVTLLHKVFSFLEKWGLINFGATSGRSDGFGTLGEARTTVKVEEAVPNAVRVGANPSDSKPVSATPVVMERGDGTASKIALPPLASHLNVFGDVKTEKLVCGNCEGRSDSGHYTYSKGDFLLCTKCFENGSYGENKLKEDFKYNKPVEKSGNTGGEWTEAETLRLLESVVKHGDDWDRVAQHVQTKTQVECIAKLIDLPFGEVVLGSGHRKGKHTGNSDGSKHGQLSSSECQETIKAKSQSNEQTNDSEQNGNTANQGPPLKRQCTASLSDASSPLITQVSALSTLVGPYITAAAAEAAVTALCEETTCSKEIFNAEDNCVTNGLQSPAINCETERVLQLEDAEMIERPTESASQDAFKKKDDIPPTLQIRAAIATGLGAAAARAKLLADQEDREIEHLLATIIGTQMKKLHCKLKNVEELELLMEKEYVEIEEEEKSLLGERIDIIQKTLNSGVPRWRDHPSLKP